MALSVTLLGTGNPFPNLDRRGPATLIEADNHRFVVDAGEGVLGQLLAAGISPATVESILLTHFHSDHTVGFPALVLGSWTAGRMRLWLAGPPGLHRMWDLYREMFDHDIEYRSALGWPEKAMEPSVTEVHHGWAHEQNGVLVTAARVNHVGEHCFGYRFDFNGLSVVVSGDTAYSPELVELSRGADVLVCNCSISKPADGAGGSALSWTNLSDSLSDHVCTPEAAGRMAAEAAVGALVPIHMQPGTDPTFVRDGVRRGGYAGDVIVGEDLLRYDVTPGGPQLEGAHR